MYVVGHSFFSEFSGVAVSGIEQSKLLHELSQTDAQIVLLEQQKAELVARRDSYLKDVNDLKNSIELLGKQREDHLVRQKGEETKLQEEQRRIVERRKQLTALGGTRAAKIMEREIDIASRALQTLEQRVMQALQDGDQFEKKIEENKGLLDNKQLQFETESVEAQKLVDELETRFADLNRRRAQFMVGLEERVKNLYTRLNGRYQGCAVAIAESGSCRSCYRSLPAQTFNLVLAGGLLQCPGCSRILITIATPADPEQAESAK